MLDLNKPIQTRDGRKARIICTDFKGLFNHSIVALISNNDNTETIYNFPCDGRHNPSGAPSQADLINVPEKKTLYFAIVKSKCDDIWSSSFKTDCGRRAFLRTHAKEILDTFEREVIVS